MRFQIGLVYFFAGLHKLQSDWLVDAQPLKLWLLHAQDHLGGPSWLSAPEVAYATSWTGAIFDLTIPFLLLWKRTRAVAYSLVIVFHVLTAILFPIGLFPWVMIAIVPVFFEPDWPRRVFRKWVKPQPEPSDTGRPIARGWVAAIVIWCVIQVVLPMRYLAYPGDDLWTEEAFRFSWKVMLIEKYAIAEFELTDPTTDTTVTKKPSEDLLHIQERMMAHQPDMILQYAHHLRDGYARETGVTPEVRVTTSRVVFNGRPGQPLVDPTVDLAKERSSLRPKHWLLPSPRESER